MIERMVGMLDEIGRLTAGLRGAGAHELPSIVDDLVLHLDDVGSEASSLIGSVDDFGPMFAVHEEALSHGTAAHRVGLDLRHGNVADAARGVDQLADVLPGWVTSARQRVYESVRIPSPAADDWLVGVGAYGDDAFSGLDDATRHADDLWRQDQDAVTAALLFDDFGAGFGAFDDGFGLFG